jgi:hypothetical protein
VALQLVAAAVMRYKIGVMYPLPPSITQVSIIFVPPVERVAASSE